MKKYLGWAVSLLFLVLVLRSIEWTSFRDSLARLRWFDPPVLILIYLLGFVVRAVRSRVLLPSLTFNQCLGGVFVGYAANNLLPGRLGELVRAQVIGKAAGIRRSTTFSNVIVERILDGFAVVLILFTGAAGLKLPEWAEAVRWTGMALFSCLMLGVLFLGFAGPRFIHLLPKGRLGRFLEGMLEAVRLSCRTPLTLAAAVLLSLLVWAVEGVMFLAGMYFFGFQFDARSAFFVLGVVNLGVLIPSSPGNVGVFQFFTVRALSVLSIPESQAVAYSVVLHVCQYAPVTLIGLCYLNFFGFRSFWEFKDKAGDVDSEPRKSKV